MKDKVKAVYEEVTEEGDEMEPLPADAVSNMYNTYNTYYNIFIYYNYVYKYTQAYYKICFQYHVSMTLLSTYQLFIVLMV